MLAAVRRTMPGTVRIKGRVAGLRCSVRTTLASPQTSPGAARIMAGAAPGATRAASGIMAPARASASASLTVSAAA